LLVFVHQLCIFTALSLDRHLFAIICRFQMPPLNTQPFSCSIFQQYSCLCWSLFTSFFALFAVELLLSGVARRRQCNCNLVGSRPTGAIYTMHDLLLVTSACGAGSSVGKLLLVFFCPSALRSGFVASRAHPLRHIMTNGLKLFLVQILLQGVLPPEKFHSETDKKESEGEQKDIAETSINRLEGSLAKRVHRREAVMTRFEQVRFRLARLGKSRSLHEIFERNRHFYYPQRLWIALLLSIVGIVFFCAVYMYFTFKFTQLLISFRIQITNILAQINSFLGSAPSYLRLMTSTLLQGLAGALQMYMSCCCSLMQTCQVPLLLLMVLACPQPLLHF
jgi:hypothetical protein